MGICDICGLVSMLVCAGEFLSLEGVCVEFPDASDFVLRWQFGNGLEY